MPRKRRVWFPNAMYHVVNRGVRKLTIFYEEEDFLRYLQILEEAKERFPFLLHAYCLMTNHVHLLIQTKTNPLSEIMWDINSKYAKYFNRKYDLVGHIFQDRYWAELIDSLKYELDVSKYIHLNPIEAHIVTKPEDYKWSSYRAYVFYQYNPYVYTDKILSHFSTPAPFYYQKFVETPDKPDPPPEKIRPFVTNKNSKITFKTMSTSYGHFD